MASRESGIRIDALSAISKCQHIKRGLCAQCLTVILDRAEQAEAENERLRAEVESFRMAVSVRCEERNAAETYGREQAKRAREAEARVAALEEALQNYGHHTMRCSAWGPGPAHRPCTCGLDAALARPAPTPEGEQG